MEDKKLVGTEGIEFAVQILRDSASYGVSMFPEDGGEWGGGEGGRGSGEDGEELGVADLIVRERARKRRKELEAEDEKEEEELRLLEESEKKKQKALKKKEKEKARKGKGKETEPPPTPPPESRPRPRPLGKGSSSASVFTHEMDGLRSSQATPALDEATDIEFDDTFRFNPKRSLRPSPTVSDFCTRTDDESSTRRVTRSVSRSVSVDVDLCSSSDDTSHSEAAQKTQPRKPNRKHNYISPRPNARNSRYGGIDSDPVVVDSTPSSPTTPAARRSNYKRQADVDLENTPMPSSRPRFSPPSPQGQSGAKVYPLQMAKERKKARHAGGPVE